MKKQSRKSLNITCFLGILVLSLGTMAQEGTWIATGSMASVRRGFPMTLLPDERVLVEGGRQSDGNSGITTAGAEIYDPASGTWNATASRQKRSSGKRRTLLPNGKVLVAGGVINISPGTPLSSAELYDPTTGTWSVTGSMNTARAGDGFSAILLKTESPCGGRVHCHQRHAFSERGAL